MKRVSLLLALMLVALAASAQASIAASLHARLLASTNEATGAVGGALARAPDGVLHIAYAARTSWSSGFDGVGATSISPTGSVGATAHVLSGWSVGAPGLIVSPNGSLETFFSGAPDSGGSGYNGPFGALSNDGGLTWSAPVDVGSHSGVAVGGDLTAELSNGTPVLIGAASGGISIQRGLGVGAPTSALSAPDSPFGGPGSAVDAATGEVVASWYALSSGSGLFLQGIAPAPGALAQAVGSIAGWGDQARQLTLAGRDSGAGVFTAYVTAAHTVEWLRYGGSPVKVGRLSTASGGNVQAGVATGPRGRIWVMWSQTVGPVADIYVTRSNMSDTRLEPVQRFTTKTSALDRLYGDGRLGPLDLLINMVPIGGSNIGIYWARVRPVLSASVSVTSHGSKKFSINVKVTDAGDPVMGAGVKAKGRTEHSASSGRASVSVSGKPGDHVVVTVTMPGYQRLRRRVTL